MEKIYWKYFRVVNKIWKKSLFWKKTNNCYFLHCQKLFTVTQTRVSSHLTLLAVSTHFKSFNSEKLLAIKFFTWLSYFTSPTLRDIQISKNYSLNIFCFGSTSKQENIFLDFNYSGYTNLSMLLDWQHGLTILMLK